VLAPDSPELRLELTGDDEPLVYCLGVLAGGSSADRTSPQSVRKPRGKVVAVRCAPGCARREHQRHFWRT
jgi:hypothetical protein